MSIFIMNAGGLQLAKLRIFERWLQCREYSSYWHFFYLGVEPHQILLRLTSLRKKTKMF